MPGRRQNGPGKDAGTGTTPTPAGEIPDPVSPSAVRPPPGHCVNNAPRRDATERIIQCERQTLHCRQVNEKPVPKGHHDNSPAFQRRGWSLDIYEPQRGSVPKPNVVPRLRDYVGFACQHDCNPNGVAATFADVSIILGQLVSPT